MTDDDVFRPKSRKQIKTEELVSTEENLEQAFNEAADQMDPLKEIKGVQDAVAQETGKKSVMPEDAPFQIEGNIPPEFRKVLEQRQEFAEQANSAEFDQMTESIPQFEASQAQARPSRKNNPTPDNMMPSKLRATGSDELERLLKDLSDRHSWEEFEWPSKGKFYNNIPPVVHIRSMTGEEEQILATPRFVKRGKAIDMIFQKCIRERIDTSELLSIDRTHLLIFLRGISYTPEYDVEIKCPECGHKFSTQIDLNQLEVTLCPDEFGAESLHGVLPESGFRYKYRLSTGSDELAISNYREKRLQMFGESTEDDTLLYRTALLLEEVEGVRDKKELGILMKRLPIADVAHLRNEINEPPFGVNTEVTVDCIYCTQDFNVDLPLETNFFFPRKKETRTQA